jgi:hypothetical protein
MAEVTSTQSRSILYTRVSDKRANYKQTPTHTRKRDMQNELIKQLGNPLLIKKSAIGKESSSVTISIPLSS